MGNVFGFYLLRTFLFLTRLVTLLIECPLPLEILIDNLCRMKVRAGAVPHQWTDVRITGYCSPNKCRAALADFLLGSKAIDS